ncbi:hypothetical protein MBM_00641 [Drepanopeziza brunnea f. sp. 'multigermtubi' MB_m1]|uniref:Uncharacterized protein n=1 Tax=Marssonina brunnea f. sp. multigermtubi (strain MB_m1) TaxID=1072389 RepID=K1XLU3_MARBU|nr:uncharacterized protein MBM_00641 [Drepanopeziza brunnea f. sp. 'multigermtubi' MB_m1]EKD21528.1 hypothetical protein MBM_00641 [Drepanopeziza brunnea f. sp. 'multigermtubi' MB_m1]
MWRSYEYSRRCKKSAIQKPRKLEAYCGFPRKTTPIIYSTLKQRSIEASTNTLAIQWPIAQAWLVPRTSRCSKLTREPTQQNAEIQACRKLCSTLRYSRLNNPSALRNEGSLSGTPAIIKVNINILDLLILLLLLHDAKSSTRAPFPFAEAKTQESIDHWKKLQRHDSKLHHTFPASGVIMSKQLSLIPSMPGHAEDVTGGEGAYTR